MIQPVLCIWSSSSPNGRRNLLFGLETQTWGFKDYDPQYAVPSRWVLFGHDHTNGSPRVEASIWQRGSVDLVVCEFTSPLYRGQAPHWPDEVESGVVIYPHRIGLTPVARLASVDANPGGVLGPASEALRKAAISNRGVRVELDVAPLLRTMGVTTGGESLEPDLSRTAGSPRPSFPPVRGRRGAGRSHDPEFNKVIEDHAVAFATKHMQEKHGWTEVEPLGKPYDLVCRNPSGKEKHVEVKGTSGAGADVEYTPNEIHHFRTCPHGADLIVVRDIVVDRKQRPYVATGGELLHVENYAAPAKDLQATGWLGRVPGWDLETIQ
ncbi:protein NO VEIN domain-containing protein [Micromonospora aurantiaca (nom. illeg.)]|uniref:protein NO VEIN domain-containing protein n=1 Tax=Micromonospora aurantiaca (nom. illeg.) TaxID=47850 RepID=UPI003EB9D061